MPLQVYADAMHSQVSAKMVRMLPNTSHVSVVNDASDVIAEWLRTVRVR